jgi:ABC-type multidrug transport system ATPase subunit
MSIVVNVKDLKKEFKISKRQRKIQQCRTNIALNGLSFEVNKGEIYALLGTNGAGKTTTLRILSTLLKPDDGKCYIDGVNVAEEPDKIRSKVGFLTSELKLDGFFTPNYLYDFFSDLYGVKSELRIMRKKELFNTLGIDKFAEVKVSNLSTGMKQRVAIAISLVHDPDIIIYDEPTNGLDIVSSKMVIDYLKELKTNGKTIIISTHIFEVVEKVADRVGIVINGKLEYEDSISRIKKEKSLEDVFFEVYYSKEGEHQ